MEVGKRDLVACFTEFGGHKGYLDAEDLHVALTAVLPTPPFHFEVTRIAEASRGRVSFDEFAAAVKDHAAEEDPRVWVRLAFREFDQRQQGFLEFEDLQRAVESIGGTAISESALRTVFAEADTDADGKVSYDEFAWIVHASKLRAPGRSVPLAQSSGQRRPDGRGDTMVTASATAGAGSSPADAPAPLAAPAPSSSVYSTVHVNTSTVSSRRDQAGLEVAAAGAQASPSSHASAAASGDGCAN